MTDALVLLVSGLAVARVTSLIVYDDLLERVRHELFLISPPHDDLDRGYSYQAVDRVPWHKRRRGRGTTTIRRGVPSRRAGFLGKLVACHHCVSVWIAGGTYAAWHYAPDVTLPVLVVAAVAQTADIAIKASRTWQ